MRPLQMVIRLPAYTRFSVAGLIKVPQNGEKNRKFGVYRSLCCGFEIVITEGSRFPDCANHPKLTTQWKAVHDEAIPRASDLPGSKRKNNDPAA